MCSAEDADSEGVEGRFYLWSPALGGGGGGHHRRSRGGGRGAPPAGSPSPRPATSKASPFCVGRSGAPLVGPETVERGRSLLFEALSSRVRPGLDDKVLTEWNAMYGSALAEAAGGHRQHEWGRAAIAIGDFLVAPSAGGRRALAAELAFIGRLPSPGLRRRLCLAGRLLHPIGRADRPRHWTVRAVQVADALIDLFGDQEGGGFFTTGRDGEALIVRTKDVFDGATPSANAVAALALARLGALTGTERYTAAAGAWSTCWARSWPAIRPHSPTPFSPPCTWPGWTQVVIAGDRPDLLATVHGRWLPDAVVAWGEPTASPLWEDREIGRAYVCQHYQCQLPTDDPATLAAQLASATVSSSPPEGNR